LGLLALHLVPVAASAAPKDAAAQRLADDAINNDYLATKFADAEKKLRKAIAMCAGAACSAPVKARLHRDLATVLVAGLNRADEGQAEFVEALKADPNVKPDKDLLTPEVDKAFQAAKGGAASAPATPPPEEEAPPKKKPAAATASGDMNHTPPPEQMALTPVPIYVELPDGVTAVKVQVRYKPFGAPDWKTLELKKVGQGYGAEIPCLDIGTTTGDLSYYVQAVDAGGDLVATSGSRNAPIKVAIKNELSGEPPHLPGRPPPAKCNAPEDCPPGLPGCEKKKAGSKGWGASCESDHECGEGLACKNGTCETGEKSGGEPEPPPPKPCEADADCEEGIKCDLADHVCATPGRTKPKKNWLSLLAQQDFLLLGVERDVCSVDNRATIDSTAKYYCLDDIGALYDGTPGTEKGDSITSGFAMATTRLMVGFDRLVTKNVMVGLRAGYAFRSTPDPLASQTRALHLELKVAYWLGKDPFAKKGVRPFVAAIAGMAEVDTKVDVPVIETGKWLQFYPEGKPTLTVWRKSGNTFGGISGGAMLPLGSGNHGLLAELKIMMIFPDSSTSISPTIGYVTGF
jgi:hypothetical protein